MQKSCENCIFWQIFAQRLSSEMGMSNGREEVGVYICGIFLFAHNSLDHEVKNKWPNTVALAKLVLQV